jgi:hypothetical protein
MIVSYHKRISCEVLERGFELLCSTRSGQPGITPTIINERQSYNRALQQFHKRKHAFDISPENCNLSLDPPWESK